MKKYGKLPARPGAVTLKFSDFATKAKLPAIPADFGHETRISNWGVMLNADLGDCVVAGGCHETRLLVAETGKNLQFPDSAVLKNYEAIGGYVPGDPSTDQGCDMSAAASYRKKTGLVDGAGTRHQIAAYLALQPGNLQELKAAMYLFGCAGIGVEFPVAWEAAFDNGQMWDRLPKNTQIGGGHYIPGVCFRNGRIGVVSWGKLVWLTVAGFEQFCDEAIAYVSTEFLTNGKSLEGFDKAGLLAALPVVAAA